MDRFQHLSDIDIERTVGCSTIWQELLGSTHMGSSSMLYSMFSN